MTDYDYDVFVSHSSKDKAKVRPLAERLRKDGLRVWFDDWVIEFGDLIPSKVSDGLEKSRILLYCMSSQSRDPGWPALEFETVLFTDPSNKDRRFIPIRLDDAEIKLLLRPFRYLDWRSPSDAEYARLLGIIKPPAAPVHEAAATIDPPRILRGHGGSVNGIALTSDGRRAVSGSRDHTVRVWDLERGVCVATLEGHQEAVVCVALTSDGRRAVSGSADRRVRVWDLERGVCVATLEGHQGPVLCVALTPDGRRVVSGSEDNTVRVWDLERGVCVDKFEGHHDFVSCVALTPDGRRVVSGSVDRTVRVWDLERGVCVATLEGHQSTVLCVALTTDGRRAVSGSEDKTVRVWDLERGVCVATLEGHQDSVWCVALTPDGRRAVSGSVDQTIRVWDLPEQVARDAPPAEASRYTNAKVLLTGDSGVGKTGLALRLVQDRFEPTVSTDGVWATPLKLPDKANGAADLEREVWLWDFAGQADYRLIHQLYMNDAALALFVFNPQADNAFEGVGQWVRDLTRAAGGKPFRKLLVAGRCDVGGLRSGADQVRQFRDLHGFGDCHETSARTGSGCDELRQAILDAIPWESLPYTVSPRIFKRIKEEIVRLKDEGRVLLRLSELKQTLEMRMPGEAFTPGELTAVVGLLAGAGVVWKLDFADYVLLQPEQVNVLAAALVRKVRKQVNEIGCILESDVLEARLEFADVNRLERSDENVVLRAIVETLLSRGLCLKEPGDNGPMLVFPSYFRRERPLLIDHPPPFVSYRFTGALDEIYTTLVVRLHHTRAFEKDQLWRDAADFKTPRGQRAGLKLTRFPDSVGELTVYLEPAIDDQVKVIFMRYIHDHLLVAGRAEGIKRIRFYACPHCGKPVKDGEAAMERLKRGLPDILCVHCEQRVPLFDLIEDQFASEQTRQDSRAWEKQARAVIDQEGRGLILSWHAAAVATEAGFDYQPMPSPTWGIDGTIFLKDIQGRPTGRRIDLQFMAEEPTDSSEIGSPWDCHIIKVPESTDGRGRSNDPLMFVIRQQNGTILWADVRASIKNHSGGPGKVVFDVAISPAFSLDDSALAILTRRFGMPIFAEPFTAQSLSLARDALIPPPTGKELVRR